MKLIIVGLGQIGYRHAQSLLTKKNTKLSIVEPNYNDYCQDLMSNAHNGEVVQIVGSLDSLNERRFDIALVSTNSGPRKVLADKILNDLDIDILVLEKVVFQSLSHFDEIIKLSHKKNVETFVNLPLRSRSILPSKDLNKCSIIGRNWGLLCNSIHFIDYFLCVMESKNWHVNSANLEFTTSKRGLGYVEAIGDITLQDSSGFVLELISSSEGNETLDWCFDINGKSISIKQSEVANFFGLEKSLSFYQSEITLDLFNGLLEGKPTLPTLKESLSSHMLLFSAMDKGGYINPNSTYEIT